HLACFGVNCMDAGRFGDGDVGHGEGRVDFHRVGALLGIGHVVVAYHYEGGHVGSRQLTNALGELALDGGRWVAVLEDVARDEDEVYVVLQGPIEGYVKSLEEIAQARGETCGGVDPTIVLHAEVDVC